jgi:hypothetical protein
MILGQPPLKPRCGCSTVQIVLGVSNFSPFRIE